jgi:hypothetical protein
MREALACRVALNAQKSLGCPGLSATRKLWQSRKVSVNGVIGDPIRQL